MAAQHSRRDRMKCPEPRHAFDRAAGDGGHALFHLARRLIGEGNRENLARPCLARGNQVGEAGGQRRGLPRSRAGQHQHRTLGRQDGLALRRIEPLQVGGFVGQGWRFGHASEVRRGERNGNSEEEATAKSANALRFRRLLPISPLSTGLLPKILLPRLGSGVHGAHVIGTAVPASLEGPQGQEETAGDQRSDLRRQAIGKASVFLGVSRYEAPEVESSCRATRLLKFFGISVSKAGRDRGFSKKGRGTSGGFGAERFPVFGLEILRKPGRAGRKTSEPSGRAVW